MRGIRALIFCGAGIALLCFTPAVAALDGPAFPAPGGTTWSATPPGGNPGDSGGLTYDYSDILVGNFSELYWGEWSAGAFQISLTGAGGLTPLNYDAGASNLPGGFARWTLDSVPYDHPTPGQPDGPLRVRLTLTQTAGTAAWIAAPPDIAYAGAVIDVLTAGSAYTINIAFEAEYPRDSGTWVSVNSLQQGTTGDTKTEFYAGYFSSPASVPSTSTVMLIAIGVFLLILLTFGVSRRRQTA
jgi:hypothetical protein